MADRRRVNGPSGSTIPPFYEDDALETSDNEKRPSDMRAICTPAR